jgi:hypothetical protein
VFAYCHLLKENVKKKRLSLWKSPLALSHRKNVEDP